MRILLTGVAGFIGSQVARRLLDSRALGVRPGQPQHLLQPRPQASSSSSALESFPNFRFFPGDLADWATMEALFAAVAPLDAVMNLVARAGVRASLADPLVYHHTNATGSLHLLELMRRYEVPRYSCWLPPLRFMRVLTRLYRRPARQHPHLPLRRL